VQIVPVLPVAFNTGIYPSCIMNIPPIIPMLTIKNNCTKPY